MTREEDLIRIAKKLDKMVSRNNTEGAMDLLKELEGFHMTLKLLQDTRIGMSVNGIRKHCTDEAVIALAKFLIKDWKRLLDSCHSSSEKPGEMKNGLDTSKPAPSPNNSPCQTLSSRKESVDSKPPSQPLSQKKTSDHLKKDRKDSLDGKVSNKLSDETKRDRKDSSDSKPPPAKKPSLDVMKEKQRKDSGDVKPGQPVKRQSVDTKPERFADRVSSPRRESADGKKTSALPAKKLPGERRESQGSKAPRPGPPQRKSSTDVIERKGKLDGSKTPTTPTSPMSPGFSSAGGPLSPNLATGDSVRDKCIGMVAAALRTDNDFLDFGANCDGMAAEIEDYIYQEIRATDMKYKNRVRSRISNLKDPKNPGLRRNVLAGSIELSRFASMSAEEMASDELKLLRNVLTQEAIREHQMAKTGGTSTDLLQCGKCKKRNCTYNQVQTRSADEPMTTFVLCNECGNRWKFC